MAEEKKPNVNITTSKVHTRSEPSTDPPKRKERVLEKVKELEVFRYSPSIVTRQREIISHLEEVRNKINEIINEANGPKATNLEQVIQDLIDQKRIRIPKSNIY